jgi:hypothetical protein
MVTNLQLKMTWSTIVEKKEYLTANWRILGNRLSYDSFFIREVKINEGSFVLKINYNFNESFNENIYEFVIYLQKITNSINPLS